MTAVHGRAHTAQASLPTKSCMLCMNVCGACACDYYGMAVVLLGRERRGGELHAHGAVGWVEGQKDDP